MLQCVVHSRSLNNKIQLKECVREHRTHVKHSTIKFEPLRECVHIQEYLHSSTIDIRLNWIYTKHDIYWLGWVGLDLYAIHLKQCYIRVLFFSFIFIVSALEFVRLMPNGQKIFRCTQFRFFVMFWKFKEK